MDVLEREREISAKLWVLYGFAVTVSSENWNCIGAGDDSRTNC